MNTQGAIEGTTGILALDWPGSLAVLSDPTYTLAAGVAVAILATCIAILRPPATKKDADPLAGLFAGSTLDTQLDRAAQRAQRTEQATRDASEFRAKVFARKAAHPASEAQRPVPPHRAERYDHGAVLAHLAQVMRAGIETEDEGIRIAPSTGPSTGPIDQSGSDGEWEEVLLLPPPAAPTQDEAVANAA